MAAAGETTLGPEPAPRENRSLLAVLRRRAWIVVVVTLLAGAVAFGVAYAYRDTYESTAKILFQQTISPELNAAGLLPTSLDADNLAKNNVEVVGSRTVAVATSRELRSRGEDLSVDQIAGDVTVVDTTQSDVVNVTASADSARLAALLASVYAQQAVRFVERSQRGLALRAQRNLEGQLSELRPAARAGAEGRQLRGVLQEVRLIADVGAGNPQVIQPGFEPDEKAGNLLQTTILGLLFGLVLGVGLALVREQADARLRSAEDVSEAFGVPVLATVPRHRGLKRNKPFEELPLEVAEAFRMLLVNTRKAQTETPRTILVTSPHPRDGKTTIAWNLAAAAAFSGLDAAVVEADMRRPSIASRYGLEPEPGLADTLSGDMSTSAVTQPVFLVPNDESQNGRTGLLQVLVVGRRPHDPWALIQLPAMDRVLEELRNQHDLVIVDAPPIPHVADAIPLLSKVDGVIPIVSLNSTRRQDAARLRDQLLAHGSRILGVVANGGAAVSGYAYAPAVRPHPLPTADGGSSATRTKA